MTLEQILSEFDKEFKLCNHCDEDPTIQDFIRTSFSKYQEELVAGIEGMRSDVHRKQIGSSEYQLGKLSVLDQVIKLIKQI